MNLQSIKEEFKNYYIGELNKQGQDTSSYDDENATISIFAHKDEFKAFLKSQYSADASVLNKSLDEIMKMDIVDGKLTQENNENETSNEDLMNQLINEALTDEKVKATLDIDGSEELDGEEINTFIQNIQGITQDGEEQENTLSFDDIAQGVEDIYNGEYQKYDVKLDDKKLRGDKAVESLLEEMYSNKKVFKQLDENQDGILSLEEQEKFKNYIKDYDGYKRKISQSDVKSAYYDILEGDFSYDNKLDFDNQTKEVIDTKEDKKSYSAKSSNKASSTKTSYGANRTSASATIQEKTIDNMNLVELQNEKETKETELKALENEHETKIKEADTTLKEKKEAYDQALNQDMTSNPEVKQMYLPLKNLLSQTDSVQNNITTLKTTVNEQEAELNTKNSTLSADKSNLNALESSKSALAAQKTDDEEQQKTIDEKIKSLEEQIQEANKKIEQEEENIEKLKETINENKEKIAKEEEKFKEINQKIDEQEKAIEEVMSESTKQAKEEYEEALEAYNTITSTDISTNSDYKTKQEELEKINEKINEKQANNTKAQNSVSQYDFDFETNLTSSQEQELEKFKANYEENQEKYQKVADATGVPAELIAAIHWRESSGNFDTYLHNGQKLGQTTTIVPKGIYFEDWTEAAIDAISSHNPEIVDENDINTLYEFAERYNGTGYRKYSVNSPYVWSGTTNYTSGKYVADHKFDPSAIDKQLGVAVMLQSIC